MSILSPRSSEISFFNSKSFIFSYFTIVYKISSIIVNITSFNCYITSKRIWTISFPSMLIRIENKLTFSIYNQFVFLLNNFLNNFGDSPWKMYFDYYKIYNLKILHSRPLQQKQFPLSVDDFDFTSNDVIFFTLSVSP